MVKYLLFYYGIAVAASLASSPLPNSKKQDRNVNSISKQTKQEQNKKQDADLWSRLLSRHKRSGENLTDQELPPLFQDVSFFTISIFSDILTYLIELLESAPFVGTF